MREEYLRYRHLVEQALTEHPFRGPEKLTEAMRYALLGGGKRLRGVLALAFCEAAGGAAEDALPLAKAMEMIHAYSLVHDDLPAMDNDVLRRGKPTCHIAYGEARAILAGDALLTEAFLCLSGTGPLCAKMTALLAENAGSDGMVGGQELDLAGGLTCEEDLKRVDDKKTGALIRAACVGGALSGGAGEDVTTAAAEYARHLGMAFQMVDDYLDAEGSEAALGKSVGKDEASGKTTYYSFLGREGLLSKIQAETDAAVKSVEGLQKADFLISLARDMAGRDH